MNSDIGSGQGGFTSLGGIPAVVRTLNSFANDPKADATTRFTTAKLDATKGIGTCFGYTWVDTAPPAPSLQEIANSIDSAHRFAAKDWKAYQGGFLKTSVLVEHGAWFHDGTSDNVRLAVVFAEDDCQWPSVSPRRRPSFLPTDGHVFSPVVATNVPTYIG